MFIKRENVAFLTKFKKTMMRSKAILVSLMTLFAVIAATVFVSANTLNVAIGATVSGVDLVQGGNPQLSVDTGDVIPVRVQVTSNEANTITDARIRVYLAGEDVEARTGKFDMLSGKTYSKLLSLEMPSSLDVSPSDDYTLVVKVESKDGTQEARYDFTVQRESYNLGILSVDTSGQATAGSTLAVDVVLKNLGSHSLDDTFVVVRIPALNAEKKVYFSDLTSTDGADYTLQLDNNGQLVPVKVHASSDKQDAAERIVYLQIPADAKAGVYSLEVEASNKNANSKVTKSIVISGNEQRSNVLNAVTSKEVEAGKTVTYELVLVNSGDKLGVYEIVPETTQNLIVNVDEPIVTVPADSSRVVKITVQAGQVTGTFNFAVNVNSNDKLVKRVNLTANIGKKSLADNVMILAVVLAIVFIVLLIVLVVLLTRKPEKTEEPGESYY